MLSREVCGGNASAVATECIGLYGGAECARLRLLIGLLYLRAGRVSNVLNVGVEILVHVFIHWPHTSNGIDALNTLQLLFVELGDKILRLSAVLLERVLCNLCRLSVNGVIPIKDILRDGHLVR